MNQFSLRREFLRKILHIIVLVFPLLLLEFGKSICLPYFLVISILFILFDIFRIKSSAVKIFYDRYFSIVTKKYEIDKLTSASYVFLSIMIVVFLFDEVSAAAALTIMILSDPVASLVGRVFGNLKLIGNKTLEGSLAFFISSIIILLLYNFEVFEVLFVSVGATLIELFSKKIRIDDNFLIPLVSATLLFVL